MKFRHKAELEELQKIHQKQSDWLLKQKIPEIKLETPTNLNLQPKLSIEGKLKIMASGKTNQMSSTDASPSINNQKTPTLKQKESLVPNEKRKIEKLTDCNKNEEKLIEKERNLIQEIKTPEFLITFNECKGRGLEETFNCYSSSVMNLDSMQDIPNQNKEGLFLCKSSKDFNIIEREQKNILVIEINDFSSSGQKRALNEKNEAIQRLSIPVLDNSNSVKEEENAKNEKSFQNSKVKKEKTFEELENIYKKIEVIYFSVKILFKVFKMSRLSN